jgi:adenosine deaminase
LNKNLIETSRSLNLNLGDIKKLIENSFKSSFLEDKKKESWLKKLTNEN